MTETPDLDPIHEPKSSLVPFIPAVCMMAVITDNEEAEIQTLAEFVTVQFTKAECRAVFTVIGKPNNCFNLDGYWVLVRASFLNSVLQQVVPASLHLHFIHHCHYFHLAGHPGKGRMYESMRKELYWPIWNTTSTQQYVTADSACRNVRRAKDDGSSKCSFPKARCGILVWTYWDAYQWPTKEANLWSWWRTATLNLPSRYWVQRRVPLQ